VEYIVLCTDTIVFLISDDLVLFRVYISFFAQIQLFENKYMSEAELQEDDTFIRM
jgi:hypothetical protein